MMHNIKQWTVFSLVVLLSLAAFDTCHAQARKIVGESFFTIANIWYENPEEIVSTNYIRGTFLPIGSKVTVERFGTKGITFMDENGMTYKIVFSKRHGGDRMSNWAYFDKYFSKKNPLSSGGSYDKLKQTEKDSIQIGEVTYGMSKEAVLMSYGLPPAHRTPSLKGNIWIYWVSRYHKKTVYFRDDKVFNIKTGF
jgi:hypothetical protein